MELLRKASRRILGQNEPAQQNDEQPQARQRVRQNSVTSTEQIAAAINNNDKTDMRNFMGRHMIQMANPMLMSAEEKAALPNATHFEVKEKVGTHDYRNIGNDTYRQIKTFELFPTAQQNERTVQANYFPMTKSEDAYSNQQNATPNMAGIKFTNQTQPMAVSTKFTGCLALRNINGQVGHVPPAQTGDAAEVSAQKSEQNLAAQQGISNVYGPSQYEKYPQIRKHNRTNVMIHKDANAKSTLFSQSLFSRQVIPDGNTNWHVRTITTNETSFNGRARARSIIAKAPVLPVNEQGGRGRANSR